MRRLLARHRRPLATLLVLAMYTTGLTHSAYGAYRAYRAPGAYGAEAPAPTLLAPAAPLAPLGTTAPYAPYARYAPYAPVLVPEATEVVQSPTPVVVFGPATYVRMSGPPNIYSASFALPAWVTGPFTMRVQNGSVGGLNRLSSTEISLNGVEVATASDFGQQVAGFDRPVTLQAQNSVELQVTSVPEGYLTLSFLGVNGDLTPPRIAVTSPLAGTFVNGASIDIGVQATDVVGPSEPGASGVNASSFQIGIDGTDRTGEFTIANGQATAPIAGLAEGAHAIAASVSDVAGNPVSTSSSFTIDRTAPQIVIVDPAAGQYTNAQAIEVRGGVIDASATTVMVDGVPATITGSEFVATAVAIGEGPSQSISVAATDAAGNTTTATVTVNVDRAPPVLAITSPADGAVLRGPLVDVGGTVSDSSTVIVEVNGQPMTVAGGAFSGQVPAADGALVLRATAHDAAGNQAVTERTVFVDSVAPVLTILEPGPDTITNQASILVRGTVFDSSATVVRAGGVDVTPVNGAFEVTLPLPSEGTNVLVVTATDAAGNTADADVNVVADRSAPDLAITSPAPGAVVPALPVQVQGTVQDLTGATVTVNGVPAPVSGSAWAATLDALPEGAATFAVVARDAAGNASTLSRTIVIDLTAPIVAITAPQSGALTSAGDVLVSGTLQDVSVLQVFVNGAVADLDPAQPGHPPRAFTATVALAEGDTTIVASATDGAGREGAAQVMVTRDATPPAIAIALGPKVTRARPVHADLTATDNLALDRVTVTVNGSLVQTFTAPPYALDLRAPAGAQVGDTLTIVAQAIDRAGNRAEATATIAVASDGAVTGQVLSDLTGRPLPGALVTIDGSAIATDDRGRYSFATGDAQVALSVTAPGMTTVDRVFAVASESGTVALDARLTPWALPVPVAAGLNRILQVTAAPVNSTPVVSGVSRLYPVALSLQIPDSVPEGTELIATPLSGQGLPGLLPLGWSPIAALDLRTSAATEALTLRAQIADASVPSAPSVALVRYLGGQWYLASNALTPDGDGLVTVTLPAADAIAVALVVPDDGDGAPTIPAIGDPLPGVDAAPIPLTATSTGVLDPPTLSPAGGTAIAQLTITSPTPLPSGTVVQAVVTETFTLASGDTISEEPRNQDFVLYRTASGLAATFPVAPSRSFSAAELVQGVVHLDILAGRESVRGQAGGSGAVTLTTTGATLSVAQGALTEDVPITFQSAVVSSFLPVASDVSPLLEFVVDFSGRTLAIGAEFSVAALQLPGLTLDDAFVLARVDLVDGRTRLVPVAIGELVVDRYVARAVHGLSGVVRGGRHVWYRVAGGVGFLRGVTDASGTGLATVVEASTLPFVSLAAINGQYAALSRPGAVTVRAHAPGTSLVGEAEATVTVNAETAVNLSLAGTVMVATITPATGAITVSPGVQVEIASAASITATSVTTALIQFQQTSDPAGAVASRLVLSGSGRTLAIVPLTRLTEGATYAVSVAGLADAVGGAILVPATTFTITSTSSPQYDLDQLVFSFPNAQGQVTLTGPPGTLAPGSTILVVNETTGEVSTLPVFNDGSVGGDLVAQISDRLIVTITDLQGRQTTFKRSEYVAEDGTTAVGNGGGEVIAPGGVEVRIPEDAVLNGVAAILKIASLLPHELPPGFLPELPDTTISSALRLESPDPPAFQKEVDLAFPKPADAPADAVYLVLRRLVGPDGQVAYETLDYAEVEGDGENAKVVTQSYPFSGYVSSVNGFSASGIDVGGVVGNQFTNYAILMYGVDLATPGRTLGGVITGRVLRPRFEPGAATPTFEPVEGALVSGVDAAGQPLFAQANPGTVSTVAVTQQDGTYALFDRQYSGGAVTISATKDGVTRTATAYEVDPQTTTSAGLRFAQNVATANLTFPAVPPASPASPVQVSVLTLDANGLRTPSNGIVVIGTPLVVGVRSPGNTVQRIEVRSGTTTTEYGVRPDPLADDPGGFEQVADGAVTFATPGSYTVTATALGAFGGVVTGHVVVRAAAVGGGNNDSLPNDAPAVITERTVPKPNATGVQIGVLPQIVFTEPVQNVPAGVTLTEEGGGTIGIMLSGVGPDGPIADLTNASIVTSITIQPVAGLKYGTTYTLALSSAIVDTDDGSNNTPAQKPLVPYTTSFTTFAPESIGQTEDTFTAGGLAVIGDRAYIATPQNSGRMFTNLRLFDVSDPTLPQEVSSDAPGTQLTSPPPALWLGMPVDLVAEAESPLTGGTVVAVATTPLAYPYHPSNVRLYDVSSDQSWRWIGAVTLGRDPIDGMARRIELKGNTLYAVTAGTGKGIQVVDLGVAQEAFNAATAGGEQSAGFWQMQGLLNGSDGFAQVAIAQTIHVDTGTGENSQLWDLAVTDLVIDEIVQPAVTATGRSPLVVANPQTGELLYNGPIIQTPGGDPATSWGFGIAAGTVAGQPIAVVSAIGAAGPTSGSHVLAVVDLTNPRQPLALATLLLPGAASAVHDVVLRDTNVFIGTTTGTLVVSVAEPSQPQLVGIIPGVSGRLGFGSDGLLFGTYRGLTQTTHAEGGLRTATLGAVALITQATEDPVILGVDRRSTETQRLRYKLIPSDLPVLSASIEVLQNDSVVRSLPALFVNGQGEVEVDAGLLHPLGSTMAARVAIEVDGDKRPHTPERRLSSEPFIIETAVPTEVEVAGEPLLITATNRAVSTRLRDRDRSQPYQAPVVAWANAGASGAVVTPPTGTTQTGTYIAQLESTGTAGTAHQVELRQGNVVLGRSSAVAVIPGLASAASLEVNRTGAPVQIPADGTTTVSFRLHQVRDVAGNAAPDGTGVSWRIEGDGGSLVSVTGVLQGNQATAIYRAGIEPADVDIVVEINGVVIRHTVQQVALSTTLTAVGARVEIEVDSPAGLPADGTPVMWGSLDGRIVSAGTLTGGRAQGEWVEGPSPVLLAPSSRIQIISTVGRSRGAIVLDRLEVAVPTDPHVSLGHDQLIGDRTTPFVVGSGPDPWTLEAETPVSVGGAVPGVPMRLVVGSLHFPAHEPVAAYGFEPGPASPDDMTDTDAYGGQPLTWNDGVLVTRELGNAWFGGGHLRFQPSGESATLVNPPMASSELGVNFGVRLSDLRPGQMLVSRPGAFSVSTVGTFGDVRLRFSALSGGVARQLTSVLLLETDKWYQVAAHIRGGYLVFQVDAEPVLTATIGAVDAGESVLRFGGDFNGSLDAIRLFDFTRAPLFTFENGQTAIDVAPDAQGRAGATLRSTGVMMAPSGIESVAPVGQTVVSLIAVPPSAVPEFGVDEALAETSSHGGPFSAASVIFSAQGGGGPPPNEAQAPVDQRRVTGIVTAAATQCLQALASGEPAGLAGWACEIGAGLTGAGGAAQGVRDVFNAGRTLYQSKSTLGDYGAAVFQVGTGVISIIPGVRAVRAMVRARAAVEAVPDAFKAVARSLDDEAAKAVAGEASELLPNSLIDELAEAVDAGRRARAANLLGKFTDPSTRKAFDRLVRPGGYHASDLVGILDGFDGAMATRLVTALDNLVKPPAVPIVLSADALRGMAVFLTRSAEGTGDARLLQIWTLVKMGSVAVGDDAAKALANAQTLQNTFTWIRQAADANINGLNRLLGQLKNEKFGLNGFKGVYNHLEVAAEVGWQNLDRVDEVTGVAGRFDRPDLILKAGVQGAKLGGVALREGAEVEVKSLGSHITTYPDVAQLRAKIAAAIARAGGATATLADVEREIGKLYFFVRGTKGVDNVGMDVDFYRQVAAILKQESQEYVGLSRSITFGWLGKRLPF